MTKGESRLDRIKGQRHYCLSTYFLLEDLYTKSCLILMPNIRQVTALILQKRKLKSVRSRAGIQIQVLWSQGLYAFPSDTPVPYLLQAQGINSEVTHWEKQGSKEAGNSFQERNSQKAVKRTGTKSSWEATASLTLVLSPLFLFLRCPGSHPTSPTSSNDINDERVEWGRPRITPRACPIEATPVTHCPVGM